jgi:hypothetical protein
LTPVSFVLVAIAPLVLWLGVVGPLGRVRQSGRAWVQFVLLLVPLVMSLLLIRDSLLNL